MALALFAFLAAVRAAAWLLEERSIGAGPVQAGLAVVRCETGMMGVMVRGVGRADPVWLRLPV